MSQQIKSIFQSRTVWWAVLTAAAGLNPIATHCAEVGAITPKDWGAAISVLTGMGLTIVYRVAAKKRLYTPDGLPGPNKPN